MNFQDSTEIVITWHPNPNVKEKVKQRFANFNNVSVISPHEYPQMVKATLLVFDSYGIQEEASALGQPVLVLRNTTERPESVNTGFKKMVGRDEQQVYESISKLIIDREKLKTISQKYYPIRGEMLPKKFWLS